MKKTTLIDYFRDYNEETVLQAIAYYNRNHDFESENRHRFDWDLFENILDNIEDGCLIVTEEDMEAIEDGYEDDCEDEWDGDDPYSDCYEDAELVKYHIEARFPKLAGKVKIFNIGPTIGSHTGPGTVALFFMGKERID